eukprot:gb/GECH01013657.1/.p1 GENE.gb/GECH01013657.1/~~gb/GECH01013657.1/.p1  ORF type:complete len:677 (+),score=162.47 gb/GECH01013657.1/:1-2031(+)
MLYTIAVAGGISGVLITLLHYVLNRGQNIPQPDHLQNQSYQIPNTEGKIHSVAYRQQKEIIDPEQLEYKTTHELFQHAVKNCADRQCLGHREKLGDGKFGSYHWRTYAEVDERSTLLASGLRNQNLNPGQCVGVYSINRPEWIETDLACQKQSLLPVALYDTLGKNAVEYIINHAEISVIVCSGDRLSRVIEIAPQFDHVHSVICMDDDIVTDNLVADAKKVNVTLLSYSQLMEQGRQNPVDFVPPKSNDLATIMYTSGTTGNPKGVKVLQKSIVAVARSVATESYLEIGKDDVHMSYLPLAHIFERAVAFSFLSVGAALGFYSGIIPQLFEDIQELKPTFMVGAPRVFTRLHDKVKQRIAGRSPIFRALFQYAFRCKSKALEQHHTTPLLDKIIFSKMKMALGGRVRWIISGSAPLDPEVQKFMEICFCTKVLQGYGLTETTAGTCVTSYYDYNAGHIGRPFLCCDVRLQDVPEMEYYAKNRVGELCVRGPSVTSGYYKAEEKTKEVLSSDGWFATGDVAELRPNGTFAIIDRKKNIFKLEQGEYVAPEYLETVYSSSKFIQQIFVYGNSYRRQLVAIVVPDPEYVETWARGAGISDDSVEALCSNEKLKNAILADLKEMRMHTGLKGFETIYNIHLLSEPFSVEGGTMTPTFKLRRFDIKKKYDDTLTKLYEEI